MLSSRVPNVSKTYFQHKVLTKISGPPTYETLLVLSNKVRANTASVPSTLGGGLYGHLGLTMSDDRYATLANSLPWITPGNPGVFTLPAGATGPQIEAAKDVWCELKFASKLCQAINQPIHQHKWDQMSYAVSDQVLFDLPLCLLRTLRSKALVGTCRRPLPY